jgi:hypothetical protein
MIGESHRCQRVKSMRLLNNQSEQNNQKWSILTTFFVLGVFIINDEVMKFTNHHQSLKITQITQFLITQNSNKLYIVTQPK